MTRNTAPNNKCAVWPKALLGLLASLAVVSANGVASASWTKTASGNGAARGDALATLTPTGTCAKSGSNWLFTISWSAKAWATYTLKEATASAGPYSTVTSGAALASGQFTATVKNTMYYFVVSSVSSATGSTWTITDPTPISDTVNNGGNCTSATF